MLGISQEFTYREMIIPLQILLPSVPQLNMLCLLSHCFCQQGEFWKITYWWWKPCLVTNFPDTDEGKQTWMKPSKAERKTVWYSLVFQQVYLVVTFQLICWMFMQLYLFMKREWWYLTQLLWGFKKDSYFIQSRNSLHLSLFV